MTDNDSRNWGAMTGAAILLAIAAGLIYYYLTNEILGTIGLPILVFGVYELLSSFLRSSKHDMYGTSESEAATLFGFLFIAAGGAIIVYRYADSIIIPIVFAIIIIVLYLVVRMSHGKKDD